MRTPETPLLNVETCSHGKTNDGGITAVQEGVFFTFPACGRAHQATRDKYEVDTAWLEEQRIADERRARLALAREARRG
ncbi:hypothetical protein HUO13_11945 [Saccharopolyspora erythraea]|uniref:hypothetical protein n=1 Tax=Saccharopolyspora erythraea TaxID=1836 RepID=UPI001BA46C9A|nr:hypothetical protein [Saccharopolyspora erythraea]QUH01427.1 hypothetical protein HUO13_11945 [Saccharopolyspora erythraea]